MKFKHIPFILFIFSFLAMNAQIQLVNKKGYYDGFFYQEGKVCYTYEFRSDTVLLNDFLISDNYLNIPVIKYKSNLKNCVQDSNLYYLPYEHDEESHFEDIPYEYLIEGDNTEEYYIDGYNTEESLTKYNTIPIERIKEIDIIRNKESIVPLQFKKDDGKSAFGYSEVPFEFISLKILDKVASESNLYNDQVVSVNIEFYDDDIIGMGLKKKLICPENINRSLISSLNESLVSFGYLEDKKRVSYMREIKNALVEFQKEFSLMQGYLDYETLEMLDIEFERN